jgi:hypothetical protein
LDICFIITSYFEILYTDKRVCVWLNKKWVLFEWLFVYIPFTFVFVKSYDRHWFFRSCWHFQALNCILLVMNWKLFNFLWSVSWHLIIIFFFIIIQFSGVALVVPCYVSELSTKHINKMIFCYPSTDLLLWITDLWHIKYLYTWFGLGLLSFQIWWFSFMFWNFSIDLTLLQL